MVVTIRKRGIPDPSHPLKMPSAGGAYLKIHHHHQQPETLHHHPYSFSNTRSNMQQTTRLGRSSGGEGDRSSYYQETDFHSYRDQWMSYMKSSHWQFTSAFSSTSDSNNNSSISSTNQSPCGSSIVLQSAVFLVLQQHKQKSDRENEEEEEKEDYDELLLVASADNGFIYLWSIGIRDIERLMLMEEEDDEDGRGNGNKGEDDSLRPSSNKKQKQQQEQQQQQQQQQQFSTDISRPTCAFQLSSGALYKVDIIHRIGFYSSNNNSNADGGIGSQHILMVAGDEGVMLYDWNKLYELQQQGNTTTKATSYFDKTSTIDCRLANFQPYPSPPSMVLESRNNPGCMLHSSDANAPPVYDATTVGSSGSSGSADPYYVYAATRDAFGCYKWSIETQQLICTFNGTTSGGSNYHRHNDGGRSNILIKALRPIPRSNLLMTGDDAGVLSLWDCQQDKLVEQINIALASRKSKMNNHASSSNNNNNNIRTTPSNPKSSLSSGLYSISCLATVHDTWWTVGGRIVQGSGSSLSAPGGFLTTLHAPTRSVVSSVETLETIQHIASSSETVSPSTGTKIMKTGTTEEATTAGSGGIPASSMVVVSVGNESVVSFWHPAVLAAEQNSTGSTPLNTAAQQLTTGSQQQRNAKRQQQQQQVQQSKITTTNPYQFYYNQQQNFCRRRRVVCSSPSCHAVATATSTVILAQSRRSNTRNESDNDTRRSVVSWTAAGGVGGCMDLYCGTQQLLRLTVS